MKKSVLLMLILFMLVWGCSKKSQKAKAPDLNVETADTVFTDNTADLQNEQTEQTEEQTNKANEKPEYKEYKFIPKNAQEDYTSGDYAVQLISLTNYDKILEIKRKLSSQEPYLQITITTKDGKTFYRLRLAQTYSKESAQKIGNKIKDTFSYINGFWIQKIK